MEQKLNAIIVDLDGTLCDTTHRLHLVEAKKWPEFYNALDGDTLNVWCLKLIKTMKQEGYHIVFVSGRPESHRDLTEKWLHRHHIFFYGELFMRKTGDYRKDAIVKEEIYREFIEPSYKVLFCIDDRKQVVDMWRSLGLVCLQCAEGDF